MKEKPRGKRNHLLDNLKAEFEDYLQWGEYQSWRHQDFVTLSKRIFDKTKVQLSTSTLKRIFGKLPYSSAPSSQTLDALAQYIDYENWLAYKAVNENRYPRSGRKTIHRLKSGTAKKFSAKSKIFISIGILLAITAIAVLLKTPRKDRTHKNLKTVSFSSQPVAEGFPNTVIFDYDVSQLSSNDIVIQQNWDTRKQFKIDKNKFEASSVYYYPGYWKAKLLVDGRVIKEHDIHMKTKGWLTILGGEPVPRYIQKEDLEKSEVLVVNKDVLKDIFSLPEPEILSYNYVSDFQGLSGDDFTLEASFKNIYDRGAGICRNTGITVMCKGGVIYVPFSIPGCVGNLDLYCSEIEQKGSENNLSDFGVDASIWNRIKCVVEKNRLKIYLNEQFIREILYKKPLGPVAGLSFSFTGAGAIDDILLTNGAGEPIFEDDFNN